MKNREFKTTKSRIENCCKVLFNRNGWECSLALPARTLAPIGTLKPLIARPFHLDRKSIKTKLLLLNFPQNLPVVCMRTYLGHSLGRSLESRNALAHSSAIPGSKRAQ